MKKSLLTVFLSTALLASSSFALTKGAEKLIELETKANAVSTRSMEPVKMPHYEIPLDMLDADLSEALSPEIRKKLIFTKKDRKYVRWVLNPEDTKWSDEVAAHFETKGIHLVRKYYFIGYQTASRSYIVEDPKKTVQFSIKSSTNKTGGNWSDKKQPVGEAIDSRLNSEFLREIQKDLPFKNIVVMDEPAIFNIPAIDQAIVMRDLAGLNQVGDKFYAPGFSVLHEEMGRKIALMNGSKDPYAFWTEHYVKATGRALGELAARTGLQFDSPHSQNFLVEFDANMKPTGRIVIRDLADLYIDKTFMNVLHKNPQDYFKHFSQTSNVLNYIAAGFGPLHGNQDPSWVDRQKYSDWNNVFFGAFEKSFSEVSGLKTSDFKQRSGSLHGKYFSNQYSVTKTPQTEKFWENLRLYKNPQGIVFCSRALN